MQVINRDLSIAVLRYFVAQRQQEIASGALRPPRQKRTPAEAAQLRESAGGKAHINIQEVALTIDKHHSSPHRLILITAGNRIASVIISWYRVLHAHTPDQFALTRSTAVAHFNVRQPVAWDLTHQLLWVP